MREIKMEEAVELIKKGDGYYSPHTHAPFTGTTGRTVVFAADRFFRCEPEELTVSVHDVLRFDRGSMVVAHSIQCSDDSLGAMIQKEVEVFVAQNRHQPWAREFVKAMHPVPTAVAPRKNHFWYNRYIVEPHDENAAS